MKYVLSIFIILLAVGGIYFSKLIFNDQKTTQTQAIDTVSLDVIPVRKNDSFYYNDSNIKGADQYAQFELKRTRKELNYDFCMVLRPSLPDGETVETYAAQVFEKWRVGENYGGKGVLFLFIEDIKKLKIEVGYELEDVYPDSYCASFQQEVKMYMSGGYNGDVFGMLMTSMLRRNQGDIFSVYTGKGLVRGGMSKGFLSGGAGVTTRDFYETIENRVNAAMDYDHDEIRAKYPAGKSPLATTESFLRVLHDGVDYPFIPMITKGSQLMRLEYPHPPSMLKRIWGEYNRSYPIHVMEDGDLAAVRFSGNDGCFYLRKASNGDWLIDFVKTWAYQASSANSDHWWVITKMQPWMFAHRNIKSKSQYYRTPKLRSTEEDPYERIRQLQENVRLNPNDPNAYFELGEYLYFECYWIRAAIMTIEKGLVIDPENTERRFMVIDMRMKFPMWDQIPHHYEEILKVKPKLWHAWSRYLIFSQVYLHDKKLEAQIRKRSPYHE
ncbi:MAG: TPM domain-containing protein [Akkermansiaceae bacterium]